MNNDVSVNGFSSDYPMDRKELEEVSPMEYEEYYDEDYEMDLEEGSETERYNNNNSSTYCITCLWWYVIPS